MKLFKNLKNQKDNGLSRFGLSSRSNDQSKGFTLIELLVVIGILAVLLAVTLIAINPARQFAQANNTKRRNDVNSILNAVNQYMADNRGKVPAGITTTPLTLKKPTGTGGLDICVLLVTQYMAGLPTDPKVGVGTGTGDGAAVTNCGQASYDTGYTIVQSATDSRITVAVPVANQELSESISVTR